jgi:hypothetical protein
MKKLLTFMVVVLAVPAVAMAAKTTAVTSGGASSLTYDLAGIANPVPPASIPIEWKVSVDDDSVWAVGGTVWGPASLTTTGITRSFPTGWVAYGVGDVAEGDTLATGGRWGGYESGGVAAYYLKAASSPYTLMTATVNGISGLGVGVYTIYFGDTPGEEVSGVGWWTNDENFGGPVPFDSVSSLTITIMETVIPEPATMLLLAGAIPFLRRRTA